MICEIKGVVIRETNMGEADKMLTIFTENGITSAIAKGVRSFKSKFMASCQLFCYSSFVFYTKNGFNWVKEAELINNFYDIRLSLAKTALAGYFCEAVEYTATSEPSSEYLSVFLNSLFALSQDKYHIKKIKSSFELRVASLLGFMPDTDSCCVCNKKSDKYTFDIMNGALICDKCKKNKETSLLREEPETEYLSPIVNLTEPVRLAIWFVIHCLPKEILSFLLASDDMEIFGKTAEIYFLSHIDHDFKSLNFYNGIADT